MKNIGIIAIVALMALSVVSATTTTLNDDYMEMQYNSVETVTYCIFEQGQPVDIDVVVDPICKEQDGIIGCSAGDQFTALGFTVVPNEPTTGADGCVDLTVTTTTTDGLFVYTVNGDNGSTYVGAETGSVLVPEFGVIASLAVLAGAGLFVMRRRK